MRVSNGILFFLVFSAHSAFAQASMVLARPLIIGASVSANYATTNPGSRAAFKLNKGADVINLAKSGSEGAERIGLVTRQLLSTRTVVIALDFLFWDSTAELNSSGLSALYRLVTLTKQAGIPLILGDIPEMPAFKDKQTHRKSLNDHIRYVCARRNNCYLFSFDNLVTRALRSELHINGKAYGLHQLTTDGMHLNAFSSDFVANQLITMINGNAGR